MAKEGGIHDVPANSIEIENLARFAVDEYNKKENANLEFVRVINAKQQIVEGFIYYITLEAKDGEITKEYETKVWVRSWLNSKEVLEFKPVTLGGITDVPGAANSVEIQDLARFAVDEHNKKQNSVLEFVKVISAKQQLVAGTNYFITLEAKDGEIKKEYEAKVNVREWLNSKELLEFKPVSVASTQIGGITDIPGAANSIEIQNLARFAVDEHNKKEHANLEFVRVVSAKKQVVEGFKYYITLEAKHGEKKHVYETQVWERPGLNSKELLEFKPAAVTTGGITDVPGAANSVEIVKLARFAVDEHNKKEKATLEFVKVISAKQQVVEGFKYYINLEAKHGEKKHVYETQVWVREWLNSKEVLEFKPVTVNPLSVSA